MPETDDFLNLEDAFSRIALELFAAATVEGTLQQIVNLAERTVDGCDAAGVLLVEDGRATPAAVSGPLALEIDRIQIEVGEGPCIDASMLGSAVYAGDLIDEVRWPRFAPDAVAAGVRSVLAYPVSTNKPSALNLYGRLPAAFGATDRAQGQLFATFARVALDAAEQRATDQRRAWDLSEALRTRELIGQAQGILMERERITAEEAFDVLRRASQRMNVKLRQIAEDLVESGESPGSSSGPGTRSTAAER